MQQANNKPPTALPPVRPSTKQLRIEIVDPSGCRNVQDATIEVLNNRSTSNSQQQQQQPTPSCELENANVVSLHSKSLIRIRRLKRMYRFWEPLDHLPSFGGNTLQHPANTAAASLPLTRSPNVNEQSTIQREVSPPRASAAATPEDSRRSSMESSPPFSSPSSSRTRHCTVRMADSSATNGSRQTQPTVILATIGSTPDGKIWQSLVAPIVLGCVIFLVALWTRQLSLVLLSDTVAMIFILVAVFITLSGLAFWLAQDRPVEQQRHGQQVLDNSGQPQTVAASRSDSGHSHCRHCATANGTSKCSDLSVIDCKPPDYWAALLESRPIQYHAAETASTSGDANRSDNQDNYSGRSLILRVDSPTMNNPPPSYEELSIGR